MSRRKSLYLLILCVSLGCSVRRSQGLPDYDQVVRGQLIFNSDFNLPRRHRLLEELHARRDDISDRLLIPTSDEPINIFLFQDKGRFDEYMAAHHPNFPSRRAFFVKNDTELNVYAYWGEQVGEDLRHELTHGYLHSVIPNLPLWLDEGLAEYFEVSRGHHGLNRQHIYHLVTEHRAGNWEPDLLRLEALRNAAGMTQLDYAESWLWTHYLLQSNSDNLKMVQDKLARLRMTGESEPVSSQLISKQSEEVELNALILDHLAHLVEQL